MTGRFEELCAALPELSEEQLRAVRLRVDFLLGAPATPAPVSGGWDDWLLRGLEHELRRRGILGRGRLPVARLAPKWPQTSAQLRADLTGAYGPGFGPRAEAALGKLVAVALVDWMTAVRVPVGPATVLRNVGNVWVALDEAFPGYVGAGMLRSCLDPGQVG